MVTFEQWHAGEQAAESRAKAVEVIGHGAHGGGGDAVDAELVR